VNQRKKKRVKKEIKDGNAQQLYAKAIVQQQLCMRKPFVYAVEYLHQNECSREKWLFALFHLLLHTHVTEFAPI